MARPHKTKENTVKLDEIRDKRARRAHLYNQLFSTPDGREILNDLNDQFGNIQAFVPGDPYATHINEGGRMVMLYINQLINEGNADGN